MNEIIIKIEETTFQKGRFDGYEITTNKQIIQYLFYTFAFKV